MPIKKISFVLFIWPIGQGANRRKLFGNSGAVEGCDVGER